MTGLLPSSPAQLAGAADVLRDLRGAGVGGVSAARQANLSERHFSRVFKAEVGVSPADHIEAVRLEAACRLLESTHASIEQVASTCGFGTAETMNRSFRRRLGTTPGQHRRHFDQTNGTAIAGAVALKAW